MRRLGSPAALVCAALVCAAAPVRAGDDPDAEPDFETARAHYRAAEQAAARGAWDEAAAEYAQALALTGDPVLHFRIADAYQHAGRCELALEHYERYLERAAPADDHAELALRRVNACQDEILAAREGEGDSGEADERHPEEAERERSGDDEPAEVAPGEAADPPSGPEPSARRAPRATAPPRASEAVAPATPAPFAETWHRGAAWTSAGAAVVLAATSGILAASASARARDLERLIDTRDPETGQPFAYDGHMRARYDELHREGRRMARASQIALGAAGAATAAATVLFLVDPTRGGRAAPRAHPSSLAPAVTRDGVGLTAHWEF